MPERIHGTGFEDAQGIARALRLLGELLQARGQRFQIVVIGGAAVNLLGIVSRATTDVDILAFARPGDPNWLNAGPASQWQSGLPPGLENRVQWSEYSGLGVGLVSRYDLIFLKLYAAVDDAGPTSVHFQDLLALMPTDEELAEAGSWVRQQDPSPVIADTVTKVVSHASSLRNRPR